MRCRMCRYMWGINKMQAVRGDWGILKGMVEEEYLIVLREMKRDVYIAVELTGRPTIRVVSHL